MTDDRNAARKELRELIALEVAEQVKTYRGASEAQLLKASADLGNLFDTHRETLEAKADELERTCAVHMDRASAIWDRIAGTWVRAVILGGFILLGVIGAGVVGIAALEQSFRWQVAKAASMAEQIEIQRQTLEQLNGGTRGLTLTDQDGQCFVVFPEGADVPAFWTIEDRPAIELECDE